MALKAIVGTWLNHYTISRQKERKRVGWLSRFTDSGSRKTGQYWRKWWGSDICCLNSYFPPPMENSICLKVKEEKQIVISEGRRILLRLWTYDVRHSVSRRDGFDGLGSWDRHRRHRRQSVPAEAMLAGYMWMLLWTICNAFGKWNRATENGRAACWYLRRRKSSLAKGSWFLY